MKGIAEYINVEYNKEYLLRKHQEIRGVPGHEYIECGTESHILITDTDCYRQWDHILTIMSGVHMGMCEHGTGFNYNPTLTSGVPPHIDFDEREGNQFNLLFDCTAYYGLEDYINTDYFFPNSSSSKNRTATAIIGLTYNLKNK